MAKRWNIADLIDLHYFFKIDEEIEKREGAAALNKRDRTIYLTAIKPRLSEHTTEHSNSLLVREWVSSRRHQYQHAGEHENTPLPGAIWREFSFFCSWLILLLGLFTGLSAAGSLLLYSGTAPLNISLYFGLFVLLQLALLGVQGALFIYRGLCQRSLTSSITYRLINRLFIRALNWLYKKMHPLLTGRQRLEMASFTSGMYQRKELAALFIRPGFIFLQLGGIGFNIGVIIATLAKVTFSDIAFAWQSSLQLSAETIAALVQWTALPWSWFLPAAVPGLEHIQGSRIILKDGIAHLATTDLISWWPFLVCAVLVYGLLPRCVLLVAGLIYQQKAVERLYGNDLKTRRLLLRMTTAQVDTSGMLEKTSSRKSQKAAASLSVPATPADRPMESSLDSIGEQWYVFIPDELFDDCPKNLLREYLRKIEPHASFGWIRYDGLETLQTAHNDGLDAQNIGEMTAGIFILQEAWQPPLKETEQMLRNLRLLIGRHKPIILLLIGRPTPATMLTPVDLQHLQVWTKKMQVVGDAFLEVRPLIQS